MDREMQVDDDIRRELAVRGPDAAIAALAGRQHGVVSRRQLAACGIAPRATDRRIAAGRLHVVHRGVYAVGHECLPRLGRVMAAVLAAGLGAVVSHRTAADLWRVAPTAQAAVEVTVPRRGPRREGLRAYHAMLPPSDITMLDAIPVTTPARTLLDLAAVVDRRRVERALERAESERLFDLHAIHAVLERNAGRRGAGRLRAALGGMLAGAEATASELERRFLALVRDAGLPAPIVNGDRNVASADIQPDICWPAAGLMVELDSRRHHHTVAAFERDRARDRASVAAGWRVVRITWRQLHGEPAAVAADLQAALAADRQRPDGAAAQRR